MSAIIRPLTREDVLKDFETFLQRVDRGEILEKVECGNRDARIQKSMEWAARMVKTYCQKYLAKGMTNDDVDNYLMIRSVEDSDAFIKAADSKRDMYRFVAIQAGRMVGCGIFRKRSQMKMAAALAVQITTMSEASIYKRINEGYNMTAV